jgi:hypothetical protein
MAIDLNSETKIWANLSKKELGIVGAIAGAILLVALALVLSVGLIVGAAFLGLGLGLTAVLVVYQASKPEGYIAGRLKYEGKFLFFSLPVKKAPAVYLPQCAQRGDYFDAALEEATHGQ